MQRADSAIAPVLSALTEERFPEPSNMTTLSAETRYYFRIREELFIVDGVLYRKRPTIGTHQLILPARLREKVIEMYHSTVVSGHMGVKATKSRLSRAFHWFQMKIDVQCFTLKCEVCEADRKPKKTPRAPMGHVKAGEPWDVLAIDFLGPLPVTARGNRFIMVATDVFTKYVEVWAIPNQTAEECALRVVNDVVARWGTPAAILTDQGRAFESHLFQELCALLHTRKRRTSARNPKCNGQVERFNQTLMRMVRAFLTDVQGDWDLYLGCLAGAYRSTPQRSTGVSPNLLAIGRETRLPPELQFPTVHRESDVSVGQLVSDVRHCMLRAHEVAREQLASAASYSKGRYDSNVLLHRYAPGDLVWFLHEVRKPGVNPKLERAYDGPFVVTKRFSDVNYELQLSQEGNPRVVNHDKLKPYRGENPPAWAVRLSRKLKRS